eukprot:CAMPEP_0118688440 /NCGR_PEP_ID=MMETSP0800-20121206/8923_1 /TAXON_ID=210618 ORGANISM="Striatella unipunctata, Strain CCMP2910" /NCGR_SAMPLE_ID=MMETSP0800 /ASSEMBLY_ACC=CAM_ASM_000638 /LENGTH=225 /DNA_ID=CAMNT_0006585703 /DNA_START=50 /DNA_END=727 /DNA_ORIENTATION=+
MDFFVPIGLPFSNPHVAASIAPVKRTRKAKKTKCLSKPRDKPKRPLSAYNLFFQDEREKLLVVGKVGFAALAKIVAEKWKSLDPISKSKYEAKAAVEKTRYKIELEKWSEARRAKVIAEYASRAKLERASNKIMEIPVGMTIEFQKVDNIETLKGLPNSPPMVENVCSANCDDNFPFGDLALPRRMKVFHLDQNTTPMDNHVFRVSIDKLVSDLDDECINFLSQI